jgi:hypothetical protein
MGRKLRDRVSFSNVMSTLAVFVAMGGTSYALTLPRNSVGPSQLRSDSVGRSEVRRGAVRSGEIRDRALRLRDVSLAARSALRGQQGPPGVTFFQTVNSAGDGRGGNATSIRPAGPASRVIGFSRSVASCAATATLTEISGEPNTSSWTTGHVTAQHSGDGGILVRTYDADGQPAQYPFNLIVAC